MESLSPSSNWSCAGVCGEVSWLGHNTTVCCVESCKYDLENQPWTVLTQLFVISHSCQRLQHLVGPLGVCPGRGRGRPPPHPGPPEWAEGAGAPLPGWLPATARLARLILLEEGELRIASPPPLE